MPQCAMCKGIFPPNYVVVIPNSQPDLKNEYPKECVFCKHQIAKVERETAKDSGEWTMYTKEECIRDYAEFLRKLKDSKNVQDILDKAEQDSGFKV